MTVDQAYRLDPLLSSGVLTSPRHSHCRVGTQRFFTWTYPRCGQVETVVGGLPCGASLSFIEFAQFSVRFCYFSFSIRIHSSVLVCGPILRFQKMQPLLLPTQQFRVHYNTCTSQHNTDFSVSEFCKFILFALRIQFLHLRINQKIPGSNPGSIANVQSIGRGVSLKV